MSFLKFYSILGFLPKIGKFECILDFIQDISY